MADSIGAFANAPYGSKVVTVSPMLVSNGTKPIGSEGVLTGSANRPRPSAMAKMVGGVRERPVRILRWLWSSSLSWNFRHRHASGSKAAHWPQSVTDSARYLRLPGKFSVKSSYNGSKSLLDTTQSWNQISTALVSH